MLAQSLRHIKPEAAGISKRLKVVVVVVHVGDEFVVVPHPNRESGLRGVINGIGAD